MLAKDKKIIDESENPYLRNIIGNIDAVELAAGATIGKYQIIEEIGRGGMAVVYKATQLDLKRDVALKVMTANISTNHRFVERFLSEAHSVAKLRHPNIVNVYEAASEGNVYFIAMEHIAGNNLFDYLYNSKPKLVDVLEIVARLAEALAYAHEQKIIHRDLKLNNVLMKDSLTPVLIDFGLAKALEDADSGGGVTRTGEIMGSPAYMAPERLTGGTTDHRSDICSLGIMLYEMLTFKNPYLDQRNLRQTTFNVMEANPIAPTKLVSWLPAEVEAITLKAMAKNPDVRYQTMREFCEDIRRYQRGDPIEAKPLSLKNRTVRYVRQKKASITIIALILLFAIISGATWWFQRQRIASRWQLVYTQPANMASDEWELRNRDPAQAGTLEDGQNALTLSSSGLSYITFEHRFSRDVRIEFDMRAANKNLARTGVFLFGENPEAAYRAHINRNGFGESGISYPNSSFLFSDVEHEVVAWRDVNKVSVEFLQNTITMKINDRQVVQAFDFFRPIGRDNDMVGFFVENSVVTLSNIRIFRRAIPQVPSPTLIADRFRERGDFESAIEEYSGLVENAPQNTVKELQVNIAECQIRLGRFADAASTIEKISALPGNELVKARAEYLNGVAHRLMGDTAKANAAFAHVAAQYGTSQVAFAIMAERIGETARKIEAGDRDGALRDIESGTILFPKWAQHWGRLHLEILDYEARLGSLGDVIEIADKIATLHKEPSAVAMRAKLIRASAYLNEGQTPPALEIYNQLVNIMQSSSRTERNRAWFALAELYEYEFDYGQSSIIYTNIQKNSPPSSITHWLAALKHAERLAALAGRIDPGLFNDIENGIHPFPLPRIIAQYYLGNITEIEFLSQWETLFPQDSWSLYYVARKLLLQGNREESMEVMRVLQRQLPVSSWRMFQVTRILHNQDKWM